MQVGIKIIFPIIIGHRGVRDISELEGNFIQAFVFALLCIERIIYFLKRQPGLLLGQLQAKLPQGGYQRDVCETLKFERFTNRDVYHHERSVYCSLNLLWLELTDI